MQMGYRYSGVPKVNKRIGGDYGDSCSLQLCMP